MSSQTKSAGDGWASLTKAERAVLRRYFTDVGRLLSFRVSKSHLIDLRTDTLNNLVIGGPADLYMDVEYMFDSQYSSGLRRSAMTLTPLSGPAYRLCAGKTCTRYDHFSFRRGPSLPHLDRRHHRVVHVPQPLLFTFDANGRPLSSRVIGGPPHMGTGGSLPPGVGGADGARWALQEAFHSREGFVFVALQMFSAAPGFTTDCTHAVYHTASGRVIKPTVYACDTHMSAGQFKGFSYVFEHASFGGTVSFRATVGGHPVTVSVRVGRA